MKTIDMNWFKIALRKLLFLTVFLTFSIASDASNPASATSIFDEMHYKEVLELTIESDFERLKTDRRNEEYQVAKVSFKDKTGELQDWNAKLKLRGRFRRMFCENLPPLKLKFKKSDLEAAGLATFNDMKLVTQCTPDKYAAQDLIKREYATYRLYNEVSEYSFRVQLLKITYIDINTGDKSREWGFLIEDTAQLKSRLDLEKCDQCYNKPIEAFVGKELRLVSVFQYMIGNSDWGIDQVQNVKLLLKGDKIIPIPYDFDFSGLVGAPYAVPLSHIGMTNIRQRIYLGFEEESTNLYNALYSLYGNRKKFIDFIGEMKFLYPISREDMQAYLTEFFDDFENIKTAPHPKSDWVILSD